MRANLKLAGIAFGVAVAMGAVSAGAQNPASSRSSSNKNPDRLICRSTSVIGSLAGRTRQCFTQAQWDRIAQGARNQTVELQGTRPSGQIAN